MLGLYLAALAFLYKSQRSLIYIPPDIYYTPDQIGLSGFKVISDDHAANHESDHAPDNGSDNLLGWWHPPADPAKASVIYFHGNGSAIYSNEPIYKELINHGFGIFALAYPGYPGRSSETPSQAGLTQAAIKAYDFTRAQNIAPEKIAFYGTSLGGGVAAQLTAHRTPALLIIESSFVSMADIAQEKMPLFPVKWLIQDRYDSAKALAGRGIPLLWIHGRRDSLIPYDSALPLYEGYAGPKESLELSTAHHTNSWHRGGAAHILSRLEKL